MGTILTMSMSRRHRRSRRCSRRRRWSFKMIATDLHGNGGTQIDKLKNISRFSWKIKTRSHVAVPAMETKSYVNSIKGRD